MAKSKKKIFLLIGILGLILGIAGNLLKRSGSPEGMWLWIPGLIGLGIFWLYTVWDLTNSKFWTADTKLKYSLMVIFLPVLGPFLYCYYRDEIIVPEDSHNQNHLN